LDLELVDADGEEPVPYHRRVVAAVEVQHTDVIEQAGVTDRVESGPEHAHVVAVGAVDRPSPPDAVALRRDRPLPAQLGPIGGVGPVPSPP